MLWLTLGIGILNLGLGFLLGVYLGYGPPGLRFFGHAAAPSAIVPTPPESMEGAFEQVTARQAEQKVAQAQAPEEPPTPATPAAAAAAAAAPPPASPAATVPVTPITDWKLDEGLVESSVLQFNQTMARSDALATDIDTRLRACRGQYDEATVRECLARLKTCCQESLQDHKQLTERFHARIGEMGNLQTSGQEIETANAELTTQIQTISDSLEKLDLQSDVRAAAERLLEEIDQLRGTWHRLRDDHETVYVALARQEGRLVAIAPQLRQDPLTGLANRIGLETTLAKWWADDWPKTRPLSLVTLDLDHFASLNAEHGASVSDHILIQIGQWMAEMAGSNSVVARIGQRFVAAVAGVDVAALGPKVESLRQSLASTTFAHEDQTMALTATAALAAPAETDTPVSVLEKLDRTLTTAREAGRNRSFVDGEQGAKALTPPEETPSPRTVPV